MSLTLYLSDEDAEVYEAAYEAVLSIAESLPCGECDENQKHWDNAPGELRGFTDCPNGGHPDPVTVAAALPGLVEVVRRFREWKIRGWSGVRGGYISDQEFVDALSALAKPQEPDDPSL